MRGHLGHRDLFLTNLVWTPGHLMLHTQFQASEERGIYTFIGFETRTHVAGQFLTLRP